MHTPSWLSTVLTCQLTVLPNIMNHRIADRCDIVTGLDLDGGLCMDGTVIHLRGQLEDGQTDLLGTCDQLPVDRCTSATGWESAGMHTDEAVWGWL